MIDTPPTHVELLAIARAVRRQSVLGDVEGLHRELARLRTELVLHLHSEQPTLASAGGTAAEVARDGQRRLLALLDDLLSSTEEDPGACNCLLRAAEVDVVLRRQAKLEAAALGARR